jgi:cytochrome c2
VTRHWRRLVFGAVLFVAFSYGFVAGAYRLPPFYQIAWLKNNLAERVIARPGVYVPPTAQSATVVPTALQRLLVKRIALPNTNSEFAGGGSLATAGDLLYVLNRDGVISVFDIRQAFALRSALPAPPINVNDLMRSRARYLISLYWFRVDGAFAEIEDDSTHVLFASHNRFDAARDCFTYNISRVTLRRRADSVAVVDPWRTILTTSPCMALQGSAGNGRHPFSGHISGGRMIAYDAERLLVTVGDFNFDGYLRPAWSTDRSNLYGKYVLVHKRTGAAEIFATGARNSMGIYRDGQGDIWATESGPQGGDELNVIEKGADYGWPISTYGIGYESTPWPPATEPPGRHEKHRQPLFAWVPSVVPTAIIRIEGFPNQFNPWAGDLLIGTLRDQSLHRLRFNSLGDIVYDERIWLGERIRDLVRLPTGELALLTDASGLLMIVADGGPEYEPQTEHTTERLAALDRYDALADSASTAAGVAVDGERLFAQKCASCHATDGRTVTGPALDGVLGRTIGSRADYSYSASLASDTRPWSTQLIHRFLLTPEIDFPNTRMQKISLTATQADSIINYLQRVKP